MLALDEVSQWWQQPRARTLVRIGANRKSGIRSGKLAGLSTLGAIRVVALPVLLQQFLQAMVGMVDKMLAGRLPENQVLAALDAIGIGSFVGWFIGIAMAALGVVDRPSLLGPWAPVGRMRLALRCDVPWNSAGLGAVVGSILWLGADPISRLMELSPGADSLPSVHRHCGVVDAGGGSVHGHFDEFARRAGETLRRPLASDRAQHC